MGRPTYEAPIESTHTNTHEHKQTHNAARQSTVRTHAVAAPFSSEEGASPPPPASCISVAISHAEAMCTATERRCPLCLPARATSTSISSLRSRWYCRFVSLFRTFSWIRRKSRTPPPARSCPAAVGLEEQHQQVPTGTVSQRDSAWA
jgi:hypothetical protein